MRVTQPQGSFISGLIPSQVTVTARNGTARLTLNTAGDGVDEANGTVRAEIRSSPGNYIVGTPSSASVTVEDDDLPPTPTGLRLNGHITDNNIKLTWNVDSKTASYTTSYNVRYVREVCRDPEADEKKCRPDEKSGSPDWTAPIALMTSGTTTLSADLPNPAGSGLHRVEVQGVNAAGEESDWSDHAFVYPTRSHLGVRTDVALTEIIGFQADNQDVGSYKYTICIDDPMDPEIASGSWTTDQVIAEIEAGIKTWETAVGDGSVISTTALSETRTVDCEDSGMASMRDRNQVIFLRESQTNRVCGWAAIGCWKGFGKDPFLLSEFSKQSLILRASGKGKDWDTMTGSCSYLKEIVAHEAGHAFGLAHPALGEDPEADVREEYLMYRLLQPGICELQAYDIVAVMANYQSR